MESNQYHVDEVPGKCSFVLTQSLSSAMEFYWVAFAKLKNVLEDVEGADGRRDYLLSLRYKLVDVLQEMDGALSKSDLAVRSKQRLPFAFNNGIDFLGISGDELIKHLRLNEINLSYSDLRNCLLDFIDLVISELPGNLPNAQGSAGRREVLQTIQLWSKASESTGNDISFLADRLHDL
jgi:hypothetical protein